MKTNDTMTENFEELRKIYGNHSEAARALGITPEHYRRVRATGAMSESLRMLIRILAGDKRPQPSTEEAA